MFPETRRELKHLTTLCRLSERRTALCIPPMCYGGRMACGERGNDIRDLAVNPPQRIALMRLLICITQAALDGPADEADWLSSRPRIAPASLAYLDKWKHRFELYGEDSFVCMNGVDMTENEMADKLEFGLAAGEPTTLFDQNAPQEGRSHVSEWFPLHVLTYQCFSPGGTIGVSMWGGISTKDRKSKKRQAGPGYSSDAPCLGASILHLLLRGGNVTESLLWNLLTREQVAGFPVTEWGAPVWELMPASPRDAKIVRLTKSYLGRLVPLTRLIRFEKGSSKMTLANGVPYPALPESRVPTATVRYRAKTEDLRYIGIAQGRHAWRELGSVLSLKEGASQGGPPCLKHVFTADQDAVDVWTGGVMRRPGQNKLLDVAEWSFHLPAGIMQETALQSYQRGVELAGTAQSTLDSAVKTYYAQFHVDSKRVAVTKARPHYGSVLDTQYRHLIDAANDLHTPLDEAWYPIVREAMQAAYRFACPHTTARQIQAFTQGLKKLKLAKFGDMPA